MIKRSGVELMERWEERRRMCGRWTKRSRRILMRLLKEIRGRTERGGFSTRNRVGWGRLKVVVEERKVWIERSRRLILGRGRQFWLSSAVIL
jgi:hypothetical protein